MQYTVPNVQKGMPRETVLAAFVWLCVSSLYSSACPSPQADQYGWHSQAPNPMVSNRVSQSEGGKGEGSVKGIIPLAPWLCRFL